ncbi:MAG: hypothetical protein WC495_05090 [Patescibacteria group bacterium]|jgi:hypothetical protein
MSDKEFFQVEIFPKVSNEKISTSSFIFEDHKFFVVPQKSSQFSIKAGRGETTGKIMVLDLYIQKDDENFQPWILAERACDIISMASKNHISCFSVGLNEYTSMKSSGFGILKGKNPPVETENLPEDLFPAELSGKIENSRIKDRLLSAIHLSRLSKIKSLHHITESLVDAVCALEAIYLDINSKNGHHDKPDTKIITSTTININDKEEVLNWFVREYYQEPTVEHFLLTMKPYDKRSAYLHRGKLVEPEDNGGYAQVINLGAAEKLHDYNILNQVLYHSLLNFIQTI